MKLIKFLHHQYYSISLIYIEGKNYSLKYKSKYNRSTDLLTLSFLEIKFLKYVSTKN